MATLNLVSKSSFMPAAARHLFLPVSIRTQINELIATQHRSPRIKAAEVASLLACAGIMPGSKDKFFVGQGNNTVGGYAVFRHQLRELGYTAVTKE